MTGDRIKFQKCGKLGIFYKLNAKVLEQKFRNMCFEKCRKMSKYAQIQRDMTHLLYNITKFCY